jgi:hypothetical protein
MRCPPSPPPPGPLPPKVSGEFLQAVAAELEHQHQRGPGAICRACRELQRKYFDPPDLNGVRKYD